MIQISTWLKTNKYKVINAATIVIFLVLYTTLVFYKRGGLDYNYHIYRSNSEIHLQQAKCNLVDAVDEYIHRIAPSSCLNAIALVDACDKYNIDIKFVLAQGQIESHFGTRGVAAKTNSVFNVYSYDGLSAHQIISSGKGYEHPDYSIEPYLKLLTKRYLVNKDEREMFNNFVDIDGKRYASAEDYESKLFNTWTNIDSTTEISKLVEVYNKYKIINYK